MRSQSKKSLVATKQEGFLLVFVACIVALVFVVAAWPTMGSRLAGDSSTVEMVQVRVQVYKEGTTTPLTQGKVWWFAEDGEGLPVSQDMASIELDETGTATLTVPANGNPYLGYACQGLPPNLNGDFAGVRLVTQSGVVSKLENYSHYVLFSDREVWIYIGDICPVPVTMTGAEHVGF